MTRILIVDDEQQNRYLLQMLLTSSGYELDEASNGIEALEIAHSRPPDIIISDILMPGMDGFNLCRAWKGDDILKKIPFIFYTATYTDARDEAFALSLGAERFIIKPAEPEHFLSVIRDTLEAHTSGKLMGSFSSGSNGEKDEYYKEYNEVLVRKLEGKMVQIKRAHQRLAVLYKAIQDLTALKPANELVEIALSAAVEAVSSHQAYFYEYEKKNNLLRLSNAVGVGVDELEGLKSQSIHKLDDDLTLAEVIRSQTPLIVTDITQKMIPVPIKEDIRSLLFVPVLHEIHTLGVLVVSSQHLDDYDEEDARNLTTLANSLAIAIENTRLFDQVQKSETYYRTILGSSADAIIGLDTAHYITVWNSGGERAFGYSARDCAGKDFKFLFSEGEKNAVADILQKAFREGSVYGFQTMAVARNGKVEDVEMTVTYLGNGMGYTAILRVITERKQKEKELESVVAISAALRQADSRTEMLSIMLDQLLLMMKAVLVGFDSPQLTGGEMVNEMMIGHGDHPKGSLNITCQSRWGDLVKSGGPYFNNHVKENSRFVEFNLPEEVSSIACAPLIAENETIGVLWVARVAPVDEHDVSMLSSIADMAANAIRRITLHEQSQRDARELALAYETTIEGWSCALDLRDKETEGHTLRVTDLTLRLARAAGLSEEELVHVRRGALLHDIGKMGIPDMILLKPDKLTDDEWEIMRRHPTYAFELLSPIEYLRPALDIPYCHHEKWNGTGYPRRLKGEDIPLVARLFAVVDVWDALLSDRPYRSALSVEETRSYIKEQSGIHFDPRAVELFFQVIDD